MLNYALSMEGHTPFRLDSELQPVVVKPEPSDPLLEYLANKTYYRSKALADYVRQIFARRPKGVFLAVTDHVPPMPEGAAFYEKWGYQGRATGASEAKYLECFLLLVVDGQVRSVGLVRHYHLYQLILNELTGGLYCARRRCFDTSAEAERAMEPDYRAILAAGIGH